MIIQSIPALANIFVPVQAPIFTDVRAVVLGPNVQVQVKVDG